MEKKITVSKLDAARRQLETAIQLYFVNGDPVSIHTLTAASYNILRDLNKKRGGSPLIIKELFLVMTKEEHRKEIRDLMNEAENFFKHADRDNESTLDFNPRVSEALIQEACSVYCEISGEYPPLFKLFQGWYMTNNQDLFLLTDENKKLIEELQPIAARLGRAGYFKNLLPVVMKLTHNE
jgi:hypothetical protein